MDYEEIKADLVFLENWEDRLEFIIDLGRNLPTLSLDEMSASYRVEGCASNVWLVPEFNGNKLAFRGGSDASIVAGLVAVSLSMVNNRLAHEVADMDILQEFDNLHLSAHLSGQRSNGLRAMAQRIQMIAKAHKNV